MIIEDSFTVSAPVQDVWDFLIDVPSVAACVPGAQDIVQEDESTFSGALVVKVGPIKTNFKMKGTMTVLEAPYRLTAKAQGRDANTSSMVSASFTATLSEVAPAQTQIQHLTDVAIRGRLGQFGQGVIRETAKELTKVFVQCIEAKLMTSVEEGTEAETAGAVDVQQSSQPSLIAIFFRALLANLRNWFRGSKPDASQAADQSQQPDG